MPAERDPAERDPAERDPAERDPAERDRAGPLALARSHWPAALARTGWPERVIAGPRRARGRSGRVPSGDSLA